MTPRTIVSVHGILQARILEWVAISSSRGSSLPRDWTQGSCIAGRFFTIWATRKPIAFMLKSLSTPLPIPHPALFLCFPSEENLCNNCDDSLFPFPHISVSCKTSPIISFVPFIALEWLWSRFPVPKPGTSASSHESNQQHLVWVAAPSPRKHSLPWTSKMPH